jgi:hypothetical protein
MNLFPHPKPLFPLGATVCTKPSYWAKWGGLLYRRPLQQFSTGHAIVLIIKE